MRSFAIRLWAMAHKEALHITRDPQVLYMALVMPLVLVFLFGYAVSFDVEAIQVALIDHDRSPRSRALARNLDAADLFVITHRLERPEEARALLVRSKIKAAIFIPRGFEQRLLRGEPADVQTLIDGADGTVARVVLAYSAAFGQGAFAGQLRPLVQMRTRTWFNQNMESARFVVPGLVGVVLAILAVLLSALTVAREWERGSMEQLFATPVDRLSVVLGKVLPYVALGLMQFLLVLTLGAWLFDVPIRGSLSALFLAVALFMVCVLGQGLLISMVTKNQQVATQVGALSAILPSLLLSGFLFPLNNMPLPLRVIAHLIPARYLIECLRGVLLMGKGPLQLLPQFGGLAALALLLIGATTARFRRRLD